MLLKEQSKVISFGLAFVVILTLGIVGYTKALPNADFFDVFYYSLQLFVMESASADFASNIPLQLARFLAPLLFASSAILLFLSSSGRKAREMWGLRLRHHVLIAGDTDLAVKQALQFRLKEPTKKTVLVSDHLSEDVVRDLESRGLLIFSSEGHWGQTLKKLKASSISTGVLMFRDPETNQSLSRLLQQELMTGHRDDEVTLLIQGRDESDQVGVKNERYGKTVAQVLSEGLPKQTVRIVYFDPYDLAAQKLLTEFGPHTFVHQKLGDNKERAHIVIFGLGSLATAWLKTALANCHHHVGEKLRITVFYDQDKEHKAAQVFQAKLGAASLCGSRLEKIQEAHKATYTDITESDIMNIAQEHATRIFDIHFEPLQFDLIQSETIEDVLKTRLQKNEMAAVYICHADDQSSLHLARTLAANYQYLDKIIAKCVVCVQDEKMASKHLQKIGIHSDFMLVFPMEEALSGNAGEGHLSFIESCAQEMHNAYLRSDTNKNEIYGKKAFLLWNELPEEKKISNRNGILHFFVKASLFEEREPRMWKFDKLRECFLENAEKLSLLEHQRWEAYHFVEGWKLGKRSDSARYHPALVPYEWLSQPQKKFDHDLVFSVLEICERHYRKGSL